MVHEDATENFALYCPADRDLHGEDNLVHPSTARGHPGNRPLGELAKEALCRSASDDVVTSIIRSDCRWLEQQSPTGFAPAANWCLSHGTLDLGP